MAARDALDRQALDAAQTAFNQGLALHRSGRLDEAVQAYLTALNLEPRQFDALHMLGVLCIQRGQLGEGRELIENAIAARPDVAAAHANLANALNRLGQHDEALARCERAIALDAHCADAHGNRGQALYQLGRADEALESYRRLSALRPGDAQPVFKQAAILRELGRWEEALASLERATALNPRSAEAWVDKGDTLLALERPTEALAAFDEAIALRPDYAEAHDGRGRALTETKAYQDAVASYDQAIALKPDYVQAWSNRTGPLRALKRTEEALESCERAIGLKPDCAEAHNNRVGALYDLRRLDEALAASEQALALNPDFADAHNNRAVMLLELRRLDEARAGFKRAVALKSDYAEAHYNLAVCDLALGEEAEGWAEYEWRWRTGQFERGVRNLPAPLWLGREDLRSRTILLHVEQGLGDAIQFCRFVPAVAALGGTVVLEAPSSLVRLFACLEGVGQIVIRGAGPLPGFDFQTPFLSLPLALGLPAKAAQSPYLSADPALVSAWRSRLAGDAGLRVGLCWAGGTRPDQLSANAIDQRRSLALEAFASFADVPGVSFYSIQKGPPAEQLAQAEARRWPGPAIIDHTADLNDFADTAALVANLDLVIACDTSTAHLAGALGKPVWILNRFDSCWRWLHGRTDSPWYPTARLFNQPSAGDWDSVVGAARDELRRLAGRHSAAAA